MCMVLSDTAYSNIFSKIGGVEIPLGTVRQKGEKNELQRTAYQQGQGCHG